ncbi:MAG TPA: TonB-dependent receptor plug domain-containing protein, partial [Opitutaceae bacterium]|nr:TonB-dependent receptor plug domain-containing protein [Opitutaceae bacterium]
MSAAILVGTALAQSDTAQLEPVVVIATRTPADIRTLGSAVDQVSSDDLSRQQIDTLAGALGGIPGTPMFANGAQGSNISIFTRGANSDQTLFMVDGIRLNDANTDYAVFLGGARLGATDSIEIARGPQSTLYGSEAVGGVISIQAQKGAGAPTDDFSLEAGSFGTVQGTISGQGAQDQWAWSVTGSGSYTSNQRQNNDFTSDDLVLRLDRDINSV